VTGISIARAAATAALMSAGWVSSVTSWIVPPVCRFAVRRTAISVPWPAARPRGPSPPPPRRALGLGVERDDAFAAGRGGPPPALRLDEFAHRRAAVAHDARRPPQRRGHHLVVDDDQAQILALEAFLDDHFVAEARARSTAAAISSRVVSPTEMPRPCSPRAGLTTTAAMASRKAARPVRSGRDLRGHPHAGRLDDPPRHPLVVADRHGDGGGEFAQRLAAQTDRPP
jgi:hypothetical protein